VRGGPFVFQPAKCRLPLFQLRCLHAPFRPDKAQSGSKLAGIPGIFSAVQERLEAHLLLLFSFPGRGRNGERVLPATAGAVLRGIRSGRRDDAWLQFLDCKFRVQWLIFLRKASLAARPSLFKSAEEVLHYPAPVSFLQNQIKSSIPNPYEIPLSITHFRPWLFISDDVFFL
jgi:hypothetical protein